MKLTLTNEEIEVARETIKRALGAVMFTDCYMESINVLDALCAAAREPESLVGKRVRFKDDWSKMGVILEENLFRIQPNLNPDFNSIVRRDDLELLEADDAE